MKVLEIANLLGLECDPLTVIDRGEDFSLHQLKRKVRYLCYCMKRKHSGESDNMRVPEKFIEYYQSHKGFEGWTNFAVTWDVVPEEPHVLYARTFSVEEEWNATIRRVVPELPVDRIWRQGDVT